MNSDDALVLLVLAIGSAIMIAMAFVSHSQTSIESAPGRFSFSKPSLHNAERERNKFANYTALSLSTSIRGRWLEF